MPLRFAIPGLAAFLLGAALASAGEPWTVTLSDGRTYEGTLVRLTAGRYLLQTDTTLLELSEDDLDPRTFAVRARQDAVPERPVGEIRHYDEVNANLTVTRWWTRHHVNEGRQAITEYRFGLAPHERALADRRTYRDWFGNELVPSYDPPRERWNEAPDARVQVTIPLAVPVAPGEEWPLTGSETSPLIERRGADLIYRHAGNYAEDNLVWLKVRLPRGATIRSITPQPSARFTQDGQEYVMWRRFYRQGERFPLEIVYAID
ncbi:MAG TPA: hypothetical protein PLL30_11900 [Candidatus Krumholzibacteria bacterium]|nr:hypothetical protein [Candidatus Krumholzibacteria bacterium]HPD72470.1 hypothetical protein [Candidatus Krumholzibacteria bacterium]HRY40598.1 hypothetical protein [Candidatus Krumholzibacteria bacterium]